MPPLQGKSLITHERPEKNLVTNWVLESLNNVNKRDNTVFLLNHHNLKILCMNH